MLEIKSSLTVKQLILGLFLSQQAFFESPKHFLSGARAVYLR